VPYLQGAEESRSHIVTSLALAANGWALFRASTYIFASGRAPTLFARLVMSRGVRPVVVCPYAQACSAKQTARRKFRTAQLFPNSRLVPRKFFLAKSSKRSVERFENIPSLFTAAAE
jgi:hypothetical protein